jgi:hypothetical protein
MKKENNETLYQEIIERLLLNQLGLLCFISNQNLMYDFYPKDSGVHKNIETRIADLSDFYDAIIEREEKGGDSLDIGYYRDLLEWLEVDNEGGKNGE